MLKCLEGEFGYNGCCIVIVGGKKWIMSINAVWLKSNYHGCGNFCICFMRNIFLSLNKHTIGHTPVQKAAYLLRKKYCPKKQKNKKSDCERN